MQPFSMANIGLYAETLDDIEGVRKAAANRLRALQAAPEDNGYGLADGDPVVLTQSSVMESIDALEKQVIKNLEKAVKTHPLGPWIIAQKGIGLKQAGRLLAKTGDPYYHNGYHDTGAVDKDGESVMEPYDRPRTVSELWAYCGYSVVGGESQRHRKGQQGNWNDTARMRAWNIAGSCLKAQGHYADVYYAAREHYADAVHQKECVRCGPSGKPAQVGSALSDGHKHARALRKVSKEFLKDLWRESKRLHEEAALPIAA